MSNTMRALLTGTGALRAASVPVPVATADQLLIRVAAVSFNNADLDADASADGVERVAGYEFSGEVIAAGDDAGAGLVGQRVMGTAPSAFAEYVVAHRRHVVPVPGAVPATEAAALPVALFTEHGALTVAGLRPGESVLVTATSSALGLIGAQVARVLGAGRVLGSTRSPGKRALLERAGVDVALCADGADLADEVLAATRGAGAEVVLDHIGGAMLAVAIESAALAGRVVSVGRLGGAEATIDLFALARRRVGVHSVSYGFAVPAVIGEQLDALGPVVLPAVADGRISATVDSVYPFGEADTARQRLRGGAAEGKVVLTLE
ncbi:quinone oxidoreductase [Nocardia neocaledoniensis NBRC 108232]|uniref:NADPH:quinone reductase-like Zn-dependent oxidoreductase n=1 Tax=Nocardia neocaledoniensis TaxID=236511 RepID=A0A317NVV7_9NOCA|nr:zinc-binding dehydrogenase [Nocardia neocaledoniensis]PWV79175.1 NADPH:quinone reductase-like Zn-dependent oxidoreductase [Nocardia neocaledoniensis]GEM35050.1 quinone oxidoreductase [Nocardia neocaledoniensis NBRC 108232]